MCVMGAGGHQEGIWNTKCVPWSKEPIVQDRQKVGPQKKEKQ